MKNRLTDLNDHLFAQMERLAADDLKPEALPVEIERAEAMVKVADTIVANARLQLDGAKLVAEHGDKIRGKMNGLGLIAAPSTNGTNGGGEA